ncbi:MAG TPA: DUF4388 domain-containing protein [Pyrinomonadaceae bacterium]|nr:DUF4388 domain-containing protein [Pyrinomonadaceae bacterium]
MKGNLTDPPLAELIREISSKGLSGTLRLTYERAQGAIYFDKGQVVFAASNLRNLRLRIYLEKLPSVTPNELEKLPKNLPDLKVLDALRSEKIITVEQADALLRAMVTDVLRVVLLWPTGTWEFDQRARFDESFQVDLEIPNLLREAAHHVPATLVTSRFLNPNEVFTRATRVSVMNRLLPDESFILSRLDEPMTLEHLVAVSGLREREAHRMIYGLALSGCVTREYWHNAFRTDTTKIPEEQREAKSLSASKFDKTDEEIDLEQFLSRVNHATDHYEILDLPLKAETVEIKDTYYKLARKYHPDRFHLKSGTQLHTNLSSAFARVTQAYETLMDASSRATYDAALQRTRAFESSSTARIEPTATYESEVDDSEIGENPEHNFREGVSALQQGRVNAAINHLGVASRLMPQEARYRAQYGKALAASERTRRLAEVELQEAVRLDAKNPTYRILLAELYIALQFHRRAQTELQKALALDPNSASANSLLKKLQKTQKA